VPGLQEKKLEEKRRQ